MEVDLIDEEEIQQYFFIDSDIRRIKNRIREIQEVFYEQSMTTRVTYRDCQQTTVGFSVEENVILFRDRIAQLKQRIEQQKMKKRYLIDYLNSIDPVNKAYLINRYTRGMESRVCQIDIDLYSEIQEINEAINFMYGYPQEIKPVDLDNGNLESEFTQILEALEV